jgi:hypothetical protein
MACGICCIGGFEGQARNDFEGILQVRGREGLILAFALGLRFTSRRISPLILTLITQGRIDAA